MNNLWLNPALRHGGSVSGPENGAGAATLASPLPGHRITPGAALSRSPGAALSTPGPALSNPGPALSNPGPAPSDAAPPRQVREPGDWIGPGTHVEWRQLWLRGAAALLLIGSAAFSYVAWSDAATPVAAAPPAAGPETSRRTPITSSRSAQDAGAATATDSDAVAAARRRVLALRQQNTDLHQRLADLRAHFDQPRTRPGKNAGD